VRSRVLTSSLHVRLFWHVSQLGMLRSPSVVLGIGVVVTLSLAPQPPFVASGHVHGASRQPAARPHPPSPRLPCTSREDLVSFGLGMAHLAEPAAPAGRAEPLAAAALPAAQAHVHGEPALGLADLADPELQILAGPARAARKRPAAAAAGAPKKRPSGGHKPGSRGDRSGERLRERQRLKQTCVDQAWRGLLASALCQSGRAWGGSGVGRPGVGGLGVGVGGPGVGVGPCLSQGPGCRGLGCSSFGDLVVRDLGRRARGARRPCSTTR